MSTAHRPTWKAAVGVGAQDKGNWSSGGAVSRQFSARDLPGHTKLKYRQVGQDSESEVNERDLRGDLEEKEREAREKRAKGTKAAAIEEKPVSEHPLLLKGAPEEDKELDEATKRAAQFDDRDDSQDSSDSDSEDDDEEEELQLRRELERIKREREEERLRKEQEQAEAEAKAKQRDALTGNPLLAGKAAANGGDGSAAVKRRWNDDVVFKNQARSEPELKRRFINDTIRNDFHRKFINKYIQ